ncbi:MAG TPA: hypothetical protein VM261_10425 [Kofleriaceae bacterium]|nr:hypothetical protein [Kofleriaceae bacterium]
MHRTRSVFLLLVAAVGVAHADAREEAMAQARIALGQYASSVHDATANGELGNNRFFDEPAVCTRAIEAGTKAGLGPTDTFLDGNDNTVLWKRAPGVCAEYARLRVLATAVTDVQPMLDIVRAYTDADGKPHKSVTGDAYRETVAKVKPCLDIVDKAVKAGAPTDLTFLPSGNYGETRIDVAALRKRCSDYLGFGTDAAAADDAREATELAALREKYGKLGITGDRLAYLVKWGHRTILGKNCVELTGKALKTSTAFYDLGDDGIVWTVYKTQWKGDKQVKYTVKRFRRDGDYQCK